MIGFLCLEPQWPIFTTVASFITLATGATNEEGEHCALMFLKAVSMTENQTLSLDKRNHMTLNIQSESFISA